MPVVELEEEDHNVDAKLQDVKFKSINLLKVRDQTRGEVISVTILYFISYDLLPI